MKYQRLGQRYRLMERIGEGGMAFVYLALDEKLGRKVAVKVLHPHMEKNLDIRKRFQLEAQAISSLDHPNIVKIYDFSGDQSENLWIVTEVISGQNLADYLQGQKNALLHPIIGTCLVREVLKALSKAHEQKIVHRDIKPENVMLTHDGRIKLMDFGIAKDMQHSGMTMTGTFMGSPSYMSPEQIRGKDVDFKSDIYSTSVLFYEIVTGRLPYTGKTTHEVVLKIIDGIYTFPRFIVPEILPEVDQIIVKGMSLDPLQRQENVDHYGASLDEVLKKYGFDESHIELERFTKNPIEFFNDQSTKIKKLEQASAQEIQKSQDAKKRRRSDLATEKTSRYQSPPSSHTSTQRGTRDLEKTEMVGEPRVFVPRAPQHPDSPPARDQRQSQYQNRSSVKPPQSPKQTLRMPVTEVLKSNQGSPKPFENANDAGGQAYAPPKPALRRDSLGVQHPPVAAYIPQQNPENRQSFRKFPVANQFAGFKKARLQRPAPWVNQPQVSQPSIASYFFGILWIGLILSLSVWGLVELNRQLSMRQGKVAGVTGGLETKKIRTQKDNAGQVIDPDRLGSSRSSSVPVTQNNSKPNTGTINQKPNKIPDTKYTDKNAVRSVERGMDKGKNPTNSRPQNNRPDRLDRVIRPLPTQELGSLTVEGSSIKQRKIKMVNSDKKPSSQTTSLGPERIQEPTTSKTPPPPDGMMPNTPKEAAKDPQDTKIPTIGKARVQISSQPASEIYVDGIKTGTTVDSTANSGWIIVSPGNHDLELRRSGYVTHKMAFDITTDAPLIIPRVDLKPDPQSNSQDTKRDVDRKKKPVNLTIKVSHMPSIIYIRNLETNGLQTVPLKTMLKTFVLENSRYLVRVEYAGQFRERTFNTSQNLGNITFFADF